ncbi:GNAT family N-acetyltransferase [Chitinimonas sp. BJYL2]|uniref:GNAT family N-acetyltransferase n=1 Tax=Chitinimonas sp. BJYL2 TaxID=2976696 RepID=UPI0022B59C3E|nr:GNAT family N-acetyltransferase [Chitinimonas sp. BJYL2]
MNQHFQIRPAVATDVSAILGMIRELADFEQLSHLVVATEQDLLDHLFGAQGGVECLMGLENDQPVAFALYFYNFSTFLGKRGLYLEDLYVKPVGRGKGYGKALLAALAKLATERQCARFDWSVLDWNENAIRFYQSLGATVMPDWRICRLTGTELQTLAAQG